MGMMRRNEGKLAETMVTVVSPWWCVYYRVWAMVTLILPVRWLRRQGGTATLSSLTMFTSQPYVWRNSCWKNRGLQGRSGLVECSLVMMVRALMSLGPK